jgi:hypothetical protein
MLTTATLISVLFIIAFLYLILNYINDKEDDYTENVSPESIASVDSLRKKNPDFKPNCYIIQLRNASKDLENELSKNFNDISKHMVNKKFSILIKLSETAYYHAGDTQVLYPQLQHATVYYNQLYNVWLSKQFSEFTIKLLIECLQNFREKLE